MKEIFKDIPNYEGLYQVSNKGTVKNLTTIKRKKTTKGGVGNHGYMRTNLTKDGTVKGVRIHQLVAMAFLEHIPNGYKGVVDHIDNNPLNNNVENLQIISQRENASKDTVGRNAEGSKKTSKYTGVAWNKEKYKFSSRINYGGKKIFLGYFDCEEKASETYQNKLKEINNEKN